MKTNPFRVLIAKDLDRQGATVNQTGRPYDVLAACLSTVIDVGDVHLRLEYILSMLVPAGDEYRAEVTRELRALIQRLGKLPSVVAVLNNCIVAYALAAYVVHDLFTVIGDCWSALNEQQP